MVAPQAIARGDGDPVLGLAVGAGLGVVGLRTTGSHAALYDAWDAAHGEPRVLKIARAESHALDHAHDLFLREARLMRAAPGAVLERGTGVRREAPSFAFLAMDVARGVPITKAEAPVDARTRAAATAIAELHRAAVIHGDLKPSHILFSGSITLIDFGSAAFVGGEAEAVRETTPAYAAPEREVRGPSGAGDVYSLGCVLFELATGARPFASLAGKALAEAHAKEQVSAGALPIGLRDLVPAMLAKRPEDRPTAAEVAAQLGAGLAS